MTLENKDGLFLLTNKYMILGAGLCLYQDSDTGLFPVMACKESAHGSGRPKNRELLCTPAAVPNGSAAVIMSQNEYIELHQKRYGYCLDYHEKKKEISSREAHEQRRQKR